MAPSSYCQQICILRMSSQCEINSRPILKNDVLRWDWTRVPLIRKQVFFLWASPAPTLQTLFGWKIRTQILFSLVKFGLVQLHMVYATKPNATQTEPNCIKGTKLYQAFRNKQFSKSKHLETKLNPFVWKPNQFGIRTLTVTKFWHFWLL